MADTDRWIKTAAIVAAAALLAGCLTSKTPLLNDANAKAKPLAPGAYESCAMGERDANGAPDCKPVRISVEGALYSIEPQGENASLGRFRPLGTKAFLAQMWEEGDSGYFYFYAVKTSDGVKMAMVTCPDIPKRTRDSLVKSGAMTVSTDGQACEVSTLKGAERAAKAFGRPLNDASNWTVFKRTGA